MGNGAVKCSMIKKNELMELSKITMFNPDLIFTFNSFYQRFCTIKKDDGVIDYQEFLHCIDMPHSEFTEHLFYAFDQNCNNSINFREFLKFFSVFQNGNTLSQTKLSFKLFSNPHTKKIDKKTLIDILSSSIQSNDTLSSFITNKDIENIVSNTFTQCSSLLSTINKNNTFSHLVHNNTNETLEPLRNIKSGNFNNNTCSNYTLNNNLSYGMRNDDEETLSYEIYSEFFNLCPHISNWMTINVDKLKSYNKAESKGCCF